jgi:hypothetical protein
MFKKVLGAVAVSATAVVGSSAQAELPRIDVSPTPTMQPQSGLQLLPSIALECKGPGASDVTSRNHTIKNTAGATILKGTKIYWKASNGGNGSLTLQTNLAPLGTVSVIESGQTNGYSCTSSFFPGTPDFVVKSVRWTSATQAQVEIQNANNFADGAASVARVRSLKCLSTQVSSMNVNVPAIPKGQSKVLTLNIAQSTADYLEATANVGTVPESDKTNNRLVSNDFYTDKSCTPH